MTLVKTSKPSGYFTQYIKNRIRNNQNFLCVITGSTGSGKSYSALRLGEKIDENFNADNICFNARQFMDLVNGKTKELHKGSVILFDELQVTMSNLDFQTLQSKLINYVLQTFRHRNFILIVTTPHFNFLNATARKLFHSRLETQSIDYNRKIIKLKPLLLQVNQLTGDIYQKYLRIWNKEDGVMPLTNLELGLPSQELIDAYEEKKNRFTTELNESINRDLNKLESKESFKALTIKQQEIINHVKEGLRIPDIANLMGASERIIYKQIELISKKGYELTAIKQGKEVIRYEIFDKTKI